MDFISPALHWLPFISLCAEERKSNKCHVNSVEVFCVFDSFTTCIRGGYFSICGNFNELMHGLE